MADLSQALLTTRFMAVIEPGRNYDSRKITIDQNDVPEHLAYMVKLVLTGKLMLGGPGTTLSEGWLIFTDAVTTYEEAQQLVDADPAVEKGILQMSVNEWYTNSLPGGKIGFFPEDTEIVRETGARLEEKGFFGIGQSIGEKIGGEIGERIAGHLGEDLGEKIGGVIGGVVGDVVGRVVGEALAEETGKSDKPSTLPKD